LTRASSRTDLKPIRLNAEIGASEILLAERNAAEVDSLLTGSPDLDHPRIANALAGAEIALHRYDDAGAVLSAALHTHPHDYGLHARRAWLLASQGQCNAAGAEAQHAGEYATGEFSKNFKALSLMIGQACRE